MASQSSDLTVKVVHCTDFKLDSGFDGRRLQCTLCVWLSDGRYKEIDVESVTNPREWERDIA